MVMRIGGLASGMDTDTIISDLMKAERIPLDKITQKKTTLEWQRDAYRDINKQLADFDKYLADDFSRSYNLFKKTVTSTNESLVTATANSASYDGSTTINSVTQLAKAASAVSSDITLQDGTVAMKSSTLSDLGFTEDANGEIVLTLSAIQADGSMKDKTFKFQDTDSLDKVMSTVNNSALGVSLFFDSGKLSISARNTGENSQGNAEIQENGTTFFQNLGFADSTNLATNGQNAIFNLNGLTLERQSNTNTINGVSYTLKSTFDNTTPVSLTASTDVDAMMEKITEFVAKYNELVTSFNDKLKEDKYRDYTPLTDEQKEAMTEKEIELWEEKAKSGLLRNDSILSSGLSNMRQLLYRDVDNITNIESNQITEMGISTDTWETGGMLKIDDTKLRKAIENDPNSVFQLFTNTGKLTKTSSGTVTEDSRGIVKRLRDSMKDITNQIENKAGKSTWTNQQFSLGKQLINIEDRISDFEQRLLDVENRYWKQFSAMEQAIQKANQQSAFLMGQFSSGY